MPLGEVRHVAELKAMGFFHAFLNHSVPSDPELFDLSHRNQWRKSHLWRRPSLEYRRGVSHRVGDLGDRRFVVEIGESLRT